MSVQEILACLKDLDPAERQLLREALAEPVAPTSADCRQAELARLRRLFDEGWCDGDGSPVAASIDRALYGHD